MIVLVIITGCHMKNSRSFLPAIPGYKDEEGRTTVLEKPLREISGIDYIGKDRLLAINDEEGKLFILDAATGKEQFVHFGKKADYEDVVRADDHIYVLQSNGNINRLNGVSMQQDGFFENDIARGQEFETLYYDRVVHSLIMICKTCGQAQHSINAYRFDLATGKFIPGMYFSLAWADIRKMAKDNMLQCRPSAAAFHPILDKLFIIASVGKVLLQCSHNGKLEKVFQLNPDNFQQPEGLTFDTQGNMFISNEGGRGKATLLRFPYHALDH